MFEQQNSIYRLKKGAECELHDPQGQGGIDQAQFVHSLLDDLVAVRQDHKDRPRRRWTRRANTMVLPVPVATRAGAGGPPRGGGEEGGHASYW